MEVPEPEKTTPHFSLQLCAHVSERREEGREGERRERTGLGTGSQDEP
jgi:hypothetical protein